MKQQLSKIDPKKKKTLQINNQTLEVSANQTALQSVLRDFREKVSFNCRAGICGACIAIIDGKEQKICWTKVDDCSRIVTVNYKMMSIRQFSADE